MDRTIQKSGFKKELLLLKPFVKEPWREFTLKEIKQLTKTTSYHYVFEALKRFSTKGILKEERKGNLNLYQLTEDLTYPPFIESLNIRPDLPMKNIDKIRREIKSPFFSLIVAGSYAEKKQKPTSDLDIVIMIPDNESKAPYLAALKEGELMIPEVHGFVFTSSELYQMLTNKEFNYGKELARKHIIIYGAEPYYRILFEAMKNGFKG